VASGDGSAYPNGIDNFNEAHVNLQGEKVNALDINDIVDAIKKMQVEMGLNPSGSAPDIATAIANIVRPPIRVVTTTTYTLSLADAAAKVICTNTGGCVVTIPASTAVNPTSGVNFASDTEITLRAGTNAGTVSVVGAAGVSVVNPYNLFALVGPAAEVKLSLIGPDAWSVNGEVGP
jgi:hypothetical protein